MHFDQKVAMIGLTYLLLAGGEARRPPLQPPSSFCTLLLGWPRLRRNQPQAGGEGAAPPPQPPTSFFTLLLGWLLCNGNNHNNHNHNHFNNNKMLVHQRMRWLGGAAPSFRTSFQLFYFTFRLASSAAEPTTTTTTTKC